MKQAYLWVSVLAIYLPAAQAVDFNKDALKSMQEEGHKIVANDAEMRAFKLPSGLCLQAASSGKAGASLLARKCNAKSNSQKWRFDKKRLTNPAGVCIDVSGGSKSGAAAVMAKCGSAKSQQWKHDGKKRLVNGAKQCLEADGAKVVAANCSNSPNQVWK